MPLDSFNYTFVSSDRRTYHQQGNFHLKHFLLNLQFVSWWGFFFLSLSLYSDRGVLKSNWKGFQRWSKTPIAYWFKKLLGDTSSSGMSWIK